MLEETIITIDGTYAGNYYCPSNLVEFISDQCINTGSTTIYLYPSLTDHTRYIRLNQNAEPVYYSSYNQQITITDITEVKFNLSAQYWRYKDVIVIFLLMIIVVSNLMRILKND